MEPREVKKVVDVELTMSNVLLPSEKLDPANTPSALDGLSADDEFQLRLIGCECIQSCGILLKLPQTAMATGTVLFHRFFYSKSFVRYNLEHVAMASIALASKIEENPRRIRDVINVFSHLKQLRSQRSIKPILLDNNYVELKSHVIKAERRILKELGFCVYVKHPNKIIILYLRVLMMERNTSLAQLSWNYMNDSLLTDVFTRFSSEAIACSCISLAAQKLNIALPRNPPWYVLFGVVSSEIESISALIVRVYTFELKKSYSDFECLLAELKLKHQESLQKVKEVVLKPPASPQIKRKLPFAPSSPVKHRRNSSVNTSDSEERYRRRRHRRRRHRHHADSTEHRKTPSSSEERFLRMQLIKQAVKSMDERTGNEVLRAERMRRFASKAYPVRDRRHEDSDSDRKHRLSRHKRRHKHRHSHHGEDDRRKRR